MARNDGIDRTSVRNLAVSDKAVGNTQQHNEREKDSYRNPDIIPQRAAWNVHFKKPKGIPPFGVQRKVTRTEMHFPGSVITHYDTFIPMGCKV